MTRRREDLQTEADPAEDDEEEEIPERAEPGTPPIDENVAGSVNAALPDRDE
jgi:hypothetical protein